MIQHVALVILSKKFVYASSGALAILALSVDPTLFAAAVVTVITAVTTSAVLIINALAKAKKDLLEQQQIIIKKAEVIQGHVDGMTTEATADRKADAKTIASLQQQLVDSERRAVLVAQGVVAATAAKAAQDQSAAQIKLVTDALHATPKETP